MNSPMGCHLSDARVQSLQIYVRLGHDHFIPNPYLFTIHDYHAIASNAIKCVYLRQHH
jgi:hypothetical protein